MTKLKLRVWFTLISFVADETGNMFINEYATNLANDINKKLYEEEVDEDMREKI
jgi:hypothetical protein